jgi:dTMP kinase
VVADRYTLSTLAYQGAGRGLDVQALTGAIYFATGNTRPDLTLVLNVPHAVAKGRLDPSKRDRFESLPEDVQARIASAYASAAGLRVIGDSVVHIVYDAEIEVVQEAVRGALAEAVEMRGGRRPSLRPLAAALAPTAGTPL